MASVDSCCCFPVFRFAFSNGSFYDVVLHVLVASRKLLEFPWSFFERAHYAPRVVSDSRHSDYFFFFLLLRAAPEQEHQR